MGADYSKELESSWGIGEVQEWKDRAKEIMKSYYLNFGGYQWHEFDKKTDRVLLRAKVCYALFGMPQEKAENIESAYSDEQRKRADELVNVIYKVHENSPAKNFLVGFVFISCKQDKDEYVLPLFCVCVSSPSDKHDKRHFVDTQGRDYKSWSDWKENNCLPMLKYAYPKLGFYTCSGGDSYEFDETRDPDIEFGNSPSCNVSSRVFRQADSISAVAGLGAGLVTVAACFTPLAPVVLTYAAVTGGTCAAYGAVRATTRLVDKGTHGQSLGDIESWMLWLSLAATPLHFATSAMNGTLAVGAQQGRIFSSSTRMVATVLNFTTLGVDAAMLSFGLANLVDKALKNQLNTLDVLQFSMSAFFFTNTLLQPKVASDIIRQAQEQHFDSYRNAMTDNEAKASFQNFLEQNQAQGSIKDRSKVVRTINKIEDGNRFFKGVGPDANVIIGGRKGRTVIITDPQGNANRVNPNKVQFAADQRAAGNFQLAADGGFDEAERLLRQDDDPDGPNGIMPNENNPAVLNANWLPPHRRPLFRIAGRDVTAMDLQKMLGLVSVITKIPNLAKQDVLGIIDVVVKDFFGKPGLALDLRKLTHLISTLKRIINLDKVNMNNLVEVAIKEYLGDGKASEQLIYAWKRIREDGLDAFNEVTLKSLFKFVVRVAIGEGVASEEVIRTVSVTGEAGLDRYVTERVQEMMGATEQKLDGRRKPSDRTEIARELIRFSLLRTRYHVSKLRTSSQLMDRRRLLELIRDLFFGFKLLFDHDHDVYLDAAGNFKIVSRTDQWTLEISSSERVKWKDEFMAAVRELKKNCYSVQLTATRGGDLIMSSPAGDWDLTIVSLASKFLVNFQQFF